MKKYLWVTYFGFLSITLLTLIGSSGIKLLDLIFSFIALICLGFYMYSDRLVYLPFWKIYLCFFIVWEAVVNYLDYKASPESTVTAMLTALGTLVFLIPLFRAMYLYSFKKKVLRNSLQTKKRAWVPHAIGVLCLLSMLGNITNKEASFGFVSPVSDFNKGQNSSVTATYVGAIWYVYFLFKQSKKEEHEL